MFGPYRKPQPLPPPPPDKMRIVLIAAGVIAGGLAIAAGIVAVLDARHPPNMNVSDIRVLEAGAPEIHISATSNIGVARDLACVTGLPGGEVKCWGGNTAGVFGGRNILYRATATSVPSLRGATSLAGELGVCAIFAGEVRCLDREGGPLTTVPGTTGAVQMSFGNYTGCAVTSSHNVVCWGNNITGALGDGTTTSRDTAAPVQNLSDVEEVRVSQAATFARKRDGSVVWWGRNWFLPKNDRGEQRDFTSPVAFEKLGRVASLGGVGETASFSCAIRVGGTVVCWGSNLPISEVPDITGVTALATTMLSACAIVGGRVECWQQKLVANQVQGIAKAHALVAAGFDGMCALVSNTDVRCWGTSPVMSGTGTHFLRDIENRNDKAARVEGLAEAAPPCTPDCSNRHCGDDGCGNDTCGGCPNMTFCRRGTCEEYRPRP